MTTSSSSSGFAQEPLATGASWTIASCRPRRGSTERAIDFEKGCYPGQEPIARQHYRGRVNRTLRVLEIEGSELPAYDSELGYEGKIVGRVTSAAADGERVIALGYVRVEVPRDARLTLGERLTTQLDFAPPRP